MTRFLVLPFLIIMVSGCSPPEMQIKNAVMDGNARRVDRLLAKDPQLIHSVDPAMGWTPLHWAAQNGDVAVVKLLLSKGADVNAYHEKAGTPLHMAVYSGHAEVVRLFIREDADLEVLTADKRESPLYLAIHIGFPEIVRLLVEGGADIQSRGPAGSTPLHTAVFAGSMEIAEYLVEKGAYLEARDEMGMAPLHWAVGEGGDPELVAWLVEKGAGPNSRDNNGFTPLHLAVLSNQVESVKHLIGGGANVNARTERGIESPAGVIPAGSTPLKAAAIADRPAIAEFLTNHGAIE